MADDDYVSYTVEHKKFRFVISTYINGRILLVPIINAIYSAYVLLKTNSIAYEIFMEMKATILLKVHNEEKEGNSDE